MTDDLARRMADTQIRTATEDLTRSAARFADDAQRYAEALKAGQTADTGMASRLAQSATDILRQAARLDGMRTIGPLVGEETR